MKMLLISDKGFLHKRFSFLFKGKGEGNHLGHSKYTAGKSPPLKGRESLRKEVGSSLFEEGEVCR